MTSKLISEDSITEDMNEQEQYLHLINLMPEKVTKADHEGNIFYFNKSWTDFTGVSKEELVKEGWIKWVHPGDVEEAESSWKEAVESGQDLEMEIRLLCSDLEYYWHMCRARPIADTKGKTIRWLAIYTVINDQKELNEHLENVVKQRTKILNKTIKELSAINQELIDTKEKLDSGYARSLIEASHDPLITISIDGKITDMNEALTTITGKTREELLNSDFEQYFTEPKKAKEIYKDVFKKGFISDFPLVLMDGVLVDVMFNGSTYKDPLGNILGAVVVARVVTEQKRIKRELVIAIETAESERKSAEVAKIKAESAVKAKEQFLSNMSHEIRTPLNAIIGFTNVILKTKLTENQNKFMSAIKTSGNNLLLLINDILDLAKVNAGQMKFEKKPTNLKLIADDISLLFEEKIKEKSLAYELDFDPQIPEYLLGDSLRITQIIVNLMGNAIKFTETGGIKLSLKLIHKEAEAVDIQISVQDSGIGIAEDRIKSIFENFQQATNDITKLYGGSGLGLTIAKQFVEGQGGTIKVASKLGKGSVFSFLLTFPKTDYVLQNEEPITEIEINTKKVRVLVAEDVMLNQLLIKTLLDGFGFESVIAINGKQAIEKLEEGTFDIILMDLQMPVMDGFEATKHIRKVLYSNIPIIALTADVTTMDRSKCAVSGMDDYLAKPIDEKALLKKIKKLTDIHPVKEKLTGRLSKLYRMKHKNDHLTNFEYLDRITSSDQDLMHEVINMYLSETPKYLEDVLSSLDNKDWKGLYLAAHKIVPSFQIVGISPEHAAIAMDIQKFSKNESERHRLPALVNELQNLIHTVMEELSMYITASTNEN
ncbi:response regulator [Aquiflexum sp. TKW24L]|uniref:response regulator n=1 Tax=Aquiflexum sp. TKW24L TaxID=2942212 RepID=UPI0020BFE4F1|nr:response regulator [Aquiflexum sp. TKW24L]MCL6259815.1 response regulator [Aquiflexum sp. TKW24L]